MNMLGHFLPFLLEITVKATILLGVAWIAGLLMKSCSAALRHTMRACALTAVLLLPVLCYLMPAWRWQGLPRFPVSESQTAHAGKTLFRSPMVSAPTRQSGESVVPDLPPNKITAAPPIARSPLFLEWPQMLSLIWLVGIVLIGLRLMVSRSRLAMLIRRAAQVDDAGWNAQVREIAVLLGIRRSVALLRSQETEVPLTSGTWCPKIIFSPDYLEWSWLRREAVVRHELAHIRRLDTLAQAICHLAITVYWFHPLVWLTARAMREEREQACDDYVLAAGTKPSDYARELLAIASGLRQPDFITALALARRSPLEGRVMALLNPALRRGSISQSNALIVALLTLCIALPLAAIQTTEPQPKSATPQTGTAAKPSPSTPSTEEAKPVEPQKPRRAPAVPAPPAAPPAPAAGVAEGATGGISGGVPGGVSWGVPSVPAIEAAPPAPPAPATPQGLPQVAPLPPPPPPPALAKPQVLPKPAPLPKPATIPMPSAAPVAPVAPINPPEEAAPAVPKDEAAKIAALAAVKAKVAAIQTQKDARRAEISVIKAKIAAEVRAATLARTSDVAKLRAESEERAAAIAAQVAETAVVRAKVAAIRAATAQIKEAVQKAVEQSTSQPASAAPVKPAPAKP